MRPQHITAENRRPQAADQTAPARASMRPQHITAENRKFFWYFFFFALFASMRPQHITAENHGEQLVFLFNFISFNEAAAYHCGKPNMKGHLYNRDGSFNEAAAYHCGKPYSTTTD